MNGWNYGCGCKFTIFVQRGLFNYREATVTCGSTAYDGGVNQCDSCEKHIKPPPPWMHEDDGEDDRW
jgi:hypothetical protein